MAKKQAETDQSQEISIELPEEISDGVYTNLAMIAHSQSEFVIDFIQMLPGLPKARVRSRVIMTPDHAQRLFNALGENLGQYEENFGEIGGGNTENSPQGFQFPQNYRGPVGEA